MYNFKLIEVKHKLIIIQFKLDLFNTLKKLLIELFKLLLKKFILNQLYKDKLLIMLKELNFKKLNHNMKLDNLLWDNQFYKKEQELKLLQDQVKKFTIKHIFNQLFKEKMLMYNLKDNQIKELKWKLLQLHHNTIQKQELKLFKYLLIKLLLNQLFKILLNKEKFIMYKLQ